MQLKAPSEHRTAIIFHFTKEKKALSTEVDIFTQFTTIVLIALSNFNCKSLNSKKKQQKYNAFEFCKIIQIVYFKWLCDQIMIKIGPIGYRMEIWFIKIDQKYASYNNGTITAQFDNNMVYVSVEIMQGMNQFN